MKQDWVGMASVAAVALLSSSPALAASLDTPVRFDIASQSLDAALLAFSFQSGIQIISASATVAGHTAPAFAGVKTPRTALTALLAESHLRFIVTGGHTVTIVPEARAKPPVAARLGPHDAVAPAPADAASQISTMGDIVVTGSRTIVNGNNSPTPVTVVTVAMVQAATPSNIADALNKLPVFSGSRGATTLGNSASNATGNFLNLRGFGIIRSLILQDGRRVPATAADGTVDVNTLPQMLTQRVDVVTGGASAVYGSDAVTGVVNFVLDKKFKGFKAQLQTGIASRGDDGSWRLGVAGGQFLAGDRLHVEGSYEHYSSDGIQSKLSRPQTAAVYCMEGAGTLAAPFRVYSDCRTNTQSFGGLIRTGPLAGMEFAANGVLTPFVHGAATGSSTIESGGDGTYARGTTLASFLKSDQSFVRADYAFASDLNGYAQISGARSYNGASFNYRSLNPATFSSTNAFLTPAQQAAASAGGATTFTFGKFFGDAQPSITRATTTNLDATFGLQGRWADRMNWDAYYTHGQTTQYVVSINNSHNGRYYAAIDAVVDPASGKVVCNVTLTNPGLYPGCMPLNPFGPTADDPAALAYVGGMTHYALTNTMDDLGANLTGDAFATWAGPVRVAISGEYRHVHMVNRSNAQATERLDCTGLRFNCSPGVNSIWSGFTTASMSASETIAEGALEATAPLARDLSLARSIDVNGGVRFAGYSVSGKAVTWKIGLDWHLNDDLSFRGTRSQDIRAPTLFDLYQPLSQTPNAFADIHTGVSATTLLKSQGNPTLQPEVAQTVTVGVVYRPVWQPDLSISVDYYDIRINNVINTVSGINATTQAVCENSGGANPLCALIQRPLAFSDRSSANYPTLVLSQPQNVARTWTRGIDAEINYSLMLERFNAAMDGRVNLRLLVSYQPMLNSILLPGQPTVNAAGVAGLAAWKLNALIDYAKGPWAFSWQTRWRSAESYNGNPTLVYATPTVPAVAISDLTATYKFRIRQRNIETFVSVQNLFDQAAPFYAGNTTSVPGINNPIVNGDDLVGRYFTTGLRLRF